MIRINASIEARITSTRLPGKVLMGIGGKPVLQLMIERVRRSKFVNDIIIATTINKADDAVVSLAKEAKVNFYRGSEEDVLQRVLDAHREFKSDIIVELTGDCPLIDPLLIDECIEFYMNNKDKYDYVSNCVERTYPDGMDTQVFSKKVLEEVAQKANNPLDREHVSRYIYKSGQYRIHTIKAQGDLFWPDLGITLDTKEDFELIKSIFEHFKNNEFTLKDILELLRQNKDMLNINKHIQRRSPA